MSTAKKKPSRLAGLVRVVVVLGALTLVALSFWPRSADLSEILDHVRDSVQGASGAQAASEGQWLQSGATRIDPQQLASLDVTQQDRSDDDYERKEFGDGWESTGDGCDVRDTVLDRDLMEVIYHDGSDCEVTSGTLHDPYTGTTIEGDLSETVQIDHIVSLGDAWYSGAEDWSAEKRESFANAPTNLVAVDASANMSKGDDSIAEWYTDWDPPSETAQCRYAAQYVDVLASYDLSVTSDDYKLLKKLEADCKSLA